jgi:hypothetical protein
MRRAHASVAHTIEFKTVEPAEACMLDVALGRTMEALDMGGAMEACSQVASEALATTRDTLLGKTGLLVTSWNDGFITLEGVDLWSRPELADWMFPADRFGSEDGGAPRLDPGDLASLFRDEAVLDAIWRHYRVVLGLCGLCIDHHFWVFPRGGEADCIRRWATPGGPLDRLLARALRCLHLANFNGHSQSRCPDDWGYSAAHGLRDRLELEVRHHRGAEAGPAIALWRSAFDQPLDAWPPEPSSSPASQAPAPVPPRRRST